jgi:hypothetical protein
MKDPYRGLEGLAADPTLDLDSLPLAQRKMIEQQRKRAAEAVASGVYRRTRTYHVDLRVAWRCPHCDYVWRYPAPNHAHLAAHLASDKES